MPAIILFTIGLIFIFCAIVILIIGINIIVVNILTLVPYVPTPKAGIYHAMEHIHMRKSEILVDLGAGNGRVLEAAEKRFHIKGIGYEMAFVPWISAWIRLHGQGLKSRVYMKNFMKQDISGADWVYIFLTSTVIPRVAEKLKKEMKRGARAISYAEPLPNWQFEKCIPPSEAQGQYSPIYIYRKE